jgi:rhomboid-like protein
LTSVFYCTRRYTSTPSYRIINSYGDLPSDYEDGEGLLFRDSSLSQSELAAIFGRNVDVASTNHMMRVLHGRRVAGTLTDLSSIPEARIFDKELEKIALEWLRKNVPLDEIDAELQRAEQELIAAEREISAESMRLGLYKQDSGESLKESTEKASNANLYGKSGLDTIRERYEKILNEKENAKRLAREKELENIFRKGGTLSTNTASSHVELRRPGQNPRLIKYLERAKVLPATPPEMSFWQRLWPSALVTLCVLGASTVFTLVYIPPSTAARLWPNVPPAAATVLSLIMMNTVVFIAWRFPPAFRLLNKYFVSVPGYPRALAILGSTFSHQTVQHLLLNMIVLWFIGTRLHDDIGRANFLAVYLSSGVLASFTSLTVFTILNSFRTHSLGASGAICGIIATYLWLHSSERFKILYLPPDPYPGMPAYAILCFSILMDVYGLRKGWKVGAQFDHYAHLGGYASGIAGGEVLKRKIENRKSIEQERMKNMTSTERIKSWVRR